MSKRQGGGRPPKLTEELAEIICEAIEAGNYRHVAAGLAGIPKETLSRWMHRTGEPYTSFQQQVLKAEHRAQVRMVQIIAQAAAAEPRHAQWWLERKFPELWGRKDRHEVTGEGGTQLIPLDLLRQAVGQERDERAVESDDLADLRGPSGGEPMDED